MSKTGSEFDGEHALQALGELAGFHPLEHIGSIARDAGREVTGVSAALTASYIVTNGFLSDLPGVIARLLGGRFRMGLLRQRPLSVSFDRLHGLLLGDRPLVASGAQEADALF